MNGKNVLIQFPDCFGNGITRIEYPAGELQVRLDAATAAQVEDASLVITQARIKNSTDLMSLLLYEDAVAQLAPDARHILRLPYLPYARADRRFVYGDCAGLEVFRKLLSVADFDEIQVLDVHNLAAINECSIINVSPKQLIRKAVTDFGDACHNHIAVMFPDAGGSMRYSRDLGAVQYLYASKKRHPATGVFEGFEVPDPTKFDTNSILIVDNICDGGGTFTGIAQELRRRGFAGRLGLYVTHGIFSKGTGDEFSGLRRYFTHFFTTNSVRSLYEANLTQWDAFQALARADRTQERIDAKSV